MAKKGIGVIGCGNMGSILVDAIVSNGIFPPSSIYISDVREKRLKKLEKEFGVIPLDSKTLTEKSEIVIIAVKPYDVKDVITEIKDNLFPSTTLISIAAGISTKKIEKYLSGKNIPVIRVMPNINVKVKAGIIPYCAGRYRKGSCGIAEKIFSPLGIVFKLPESKFDLITAISGSGPGFLFYIAECIKKICREKGLPGKQATLITQYLFYGSGRMLFESKQQPEKLKAAVTSPGGTTQAGLDVFEKEKFPFILRKVIDSAEKRSKEIREKLE